MVLSSSLIRPVRRLGYAQAAVLSLVMLFMATTTLVVVKPMHASATIRGCYGGDRTAGKFTQLSVTDCYTIDRELTKTVDCYFRAPGAPSNLGPSAFVQIPCSEIDAANPTNGAALPVVAVKRDCNSPSGITTSNCGILKYIALFTNVLSGLVGIAVVITIVIAGIQYSMAGSNPQAVAAARAKIRNGIIALMLYLFMFAFLQWIIPGGLL